MLALVVAALVAADRLVAALAGRQVAARLQSSERLAERPTVTIRGFPFLDQVLRGRYDRVDVIATGLSQGGVRLTRVDATLVGARVPLGAVLRRHVDEVPVEGIRASTLVDFADINAALRSRGLTASAAGDQLVVTGQVTLLGRSLTASATSDVRVEGDRLIATARRVEVGGGIAAEALTAATAGRMDFTVGTATLPFHLRLTGVRVTPDGLVGSAESGPTVLRR